ncbi:MAG: N-terminal methylation [Sulfurimonas sp. RIFOXYD12_FULL_33_39]|uniref:pilus assembly FimT family protein n=1 Tax=unclassified Sulfurimonas TaxID=2623549 RepID=UPI0008BE672B|nr:MULTISPECIES: prepilin-type N-terminal cleavage/methylation domain-containing protein [unclassified Sulfurimonas]OHE10613.1 MAG: N-terminal methylation [Sulfurimonas sp. RIFOXYD12_FULL_33_39]OHE15073.1 MAG: N-terminal methylation [Sulfurimonas sp. RIFOXYD2_FULL_34_21]DAB27429.1 MAG TPA: type II/IV secretion system protein [Sulfurimonas sp. UBA10385]
MKKAFTMMEVIIVIVVIGILAAVVIPRSGSNKLAEAATQVVSHIRYTQHLAIVDGKFNGSDSNWYKNRWQIIFGTSASTNSMPAYTIFSDAAGGSTGQPDISEMAVNPMDSSKLLSGGYSGILNTANSKSTKTMNLGEYGISSYNLTGGCSGARVSFDHLGRPMRGNLSSMSGAYIAGTQRLITQTCNIVLTSSEGTVTIAIEPESGYSHIL